jgi:hypothetical protein
VPDKDYILLKEKVNVLTCSLKNIPSEDATTLQEISLSFDDAPEKRWAIRTYFGFIILPDMLKNPVNEMKAAGLSDGSIALFT